MRLAEEELSAAIRENNKAQEALAHQARALGDVPEAEEVLHCPQANEDIHPPVQPGLPRAIESDPSTSDDGDDDLDIDADEGPANNGGSPPDRWWRRLIDRLLACLGHLGHSFGERVHLTIFRYQLESLPASSILQEFLRPGMTITCCNILSPRS